jgi:hypothetical protein
MTVQLRIPPTLETRLQAEANARGEDVETVVVDALLEKFGNLGDANATAGRLSVEDLDLALSELSFDGPGLPTNFSRADIYSDHD